MPKGREVGSKKTSWDKYSECQFASHYDLPISLEVILVEGTRYDSKACVDRQGRPPLSIAYEAVKATARRTKRTKHQELPAVRNLRPPVLGRVTWR